MRSEVNDNKIKKREKKKKRKTTVKKIMQHKHK